MKQIPSAEEFLNSKNYWHSEEYSSLLIEFAKLHVQAALSSAAKNAKFNVSSWGTKHYEESLTTFGDDVVEINKDSILNAYDLNLIQ